MQFLGGNRRKLRLADDQRNACYPHSLLFYLQPPSGNISLIEFENLAIDRVKLLKAVKNLGVSYVKGTAQYQIFYPRTKFSFLEDSHLQFEAISDEEKTLREQDIMASSHSLGRKVYLENGFAYVQLKDIVAIILNEFRTKLSKVLALTARSLPAVQTDERLQPLLNHLSHLYTGQDYSTQANVGKVSLDQIDSLSTKSFPPCIDQLHKALRENHHLRHGGRMQYGLFLKDIGLTLEQAWQFWKQTFIRGKMDPDKFDKGYSYNIRHSFGKEGKRTDYTLYSCLKIILTNPPSQGDYHGCPFWHSDPGLMRQKLQAYKIPPSGINQILDLVKGTHYQ
eukprot:bmy_12789T0